MLIGEILQRGLDNYPARSAVIMGDQMLTYAQLADRCAAVSAALQALTEPGERVAVLSQNRVEFADWYYAVPAAGLTLTLVNHRLTATEVRQILQDAEAAILIVEHDLLRKVGDSLENLEFLRQVFVLDAEESAENSYHRLLTAGRQSVPGRASSADVAWLVYTSGTSGRPKGVPLTHENLVSGVTSWSIDYGSRPGESWLVAFPLCHLAGSACLGYHLRGSTAVLRPRFDAVDFMSYVQRHRVDGASLAPTMISSIVNHPDFSTYDLSSLRMITYGSSPISAELLRKTARALPKVDLIQSYAMTELGGSVLCLDAVDHRRALQGKADLLSAAGRRMAMTSVRILDEHTRTPVIPGSVGEIAVRGPQVLKEYWRRPEETAACFLDGWFLTGDLAREDADGYVTIVDRLKDKIVTGGENVYSSEVEQVLAALPGVNEVAVVGIPDEHWGERVCAVLVLDPGTEFDRVAAVRHCRERLAAYKCPKEFLVVAELPRTGSGKPLKRELRALLLAAVPD